jgi:hypothetical protein
MIKPHIILNDGIRAGATFLMEVQGKQNPPLRRPGEVNTKAEEAPGKPGKRTVPASGSPAGKGSEWSAARQYFLMVKVAVKVVPAFPFPADSA